MENTKYGRRREGRWTPLRAKAQDTRANPNGWETHLVRKRWDIGLLRSLSLRIIMMMMVMKHSFHDKHCDDDYNIDFCFVSLELEDDDDDDGFVVYLLRGDYNDDENNEEELIAI